jgi:hypothetical protein
MNTGLSAYESGRSTARAALALLVVLLSGACTTYHKQSLEIKRSFAESDYEQALEQVDEIDRGTSELLYLYEKGLILHYCDRFAESNEVFERAELLLEELYTKSVTRELAALAVSDNIAKYRGTSYEAILVNYYKILNYLLLGDLDGALVECRRVNRKLEFLRDTEGVFFANDPFIQYLTGMVYGAANELGDADVSFRVACDEYEALAADYGVEAPAMLYCDRRETARLLGDDAPGDSVVVACPAPPAPGEGVLNLFLECGYVAHKQERKVILPIFKDDDREDVDALAEVLAAREGVAATAYGGDRKVDYLLKIAMPVMVPTPVQWDYAVVRPQWRSPPGETAEEAREAAPDALPETAPAEAAVRTDVVENVDSYALAAFEEAYGKILFRTVVRALSKYAAKEGAASEDEALGWMVNWFNVATESADTREWTTLPEKILMARLVLPAGRYDLHIALFDASGRATGGLVVENVVVDRGRTTFLNHRVF